MAYLRDEILRRTVARERAQRTIGRLRRRYLTLAARTRLQVRLERLRLRRGQLTLKVRP